MSTTSTIKNWDGSKSTHTGAEGVDLFEQNFELFLMGWTFLWVLIVIFISLLISLCIATFANGFKKERADSSRAAVRLPEESQNQISFKDDERNSVLSKKLQQGVYLEGEQIQFSSTENQEVFTLSLSEEHQIICTSVPDVDSVSEHMQSSLSPEYITMKEMLADLVDLLAGNVSVISQLNNHLFSSDLIPKAVHVTVESTAGLTPYDRANKIFSSVLATLECHPNPNSVFSFLITSLQKVGLNNMAYKLMENLKVKSGPGSVNLNPEEQALVSEGPLQPVNVTAQSHTPQPTTTHSQSSSTTVIELSSKSEVATNIKRLHSHFATLNVKMRVEIIKIVQKGDVELIDIARSAAAYLSIELSSLKYGDVDELFDSLQPHYDFFNCIVLRHLADTYLSNAQTELTQYIDSVDKFSESSQLKHIRSVIKEKLSSLSAATSPTTSNQIKPVVIKLNDRWEEMTISKLKTVLKHYFGVTSDLFSHITFDYGSFVITLLIPTSVSQSLIDAINNKTNSMNRLGVLEVAVDKNIIFIRREDDDNFNVSLHESVTAGDSFEVSMLLQLGADPNSKDERGKSAVEIAIKRGYTLVKEILLTCGGKEPGEVEWDCEDVSWFFMYSWFTNGPLGVAVNDDVLIVIENYNNCITILDRQRGRKVKSLGGEGGSGNVNFSCPHDIAITPDKFILVCDDHRIQKISMEGHLIASCGNWGSGPQQFKSPEGMAISPITEKIYVADSNNHRIQVLQPDLSFSFAFGNKGSSYQQFNKPTDVSIDNQGYVYIADWGNHRIQKFSCDGRFVLSFGSEGSGCGKFTNLAGITIDILRNLVYVCDSDSCNIQVFTDSGKFISSFGEKGFHFKSLRKITFNKRLLYVCDFRNNTIFVYT